MDDRLTQHVRNALEKQQIAVAWMDGPSRMDGSRPLDVALEHRPAAIHGFGNLVFVNASAAPPRVITAYFDRRRTQQ
jgi:7-keto-8-aminopelargonate synthetase-like enzyme